MTGDIVWLEMQHGTARRVRTFTYVLWAAVGTFCAIVSLVTTRHVVTHHRFLLLALFAACLSPMLVLLWVATYYRSFYWIPLSLGSDGRRFLLRGKNAQVVESVPIDEVRTDGEFLLIGRRLVPLHHMYRAAYDMDRLRTEFIGRLPFSALLSRNALLWRALRAGNRALILIILVICLVECLKALS